MAVGAAHAAGGGHHRRRDGLGQDGAAGSVPGGPAPQRPLPPLHHRVPRHCAAPVAARAPPLVPALPRRRPARVPARRQCPAALPPVRSPPTQLPRATFPVCSNIQSHRFLTLTSIIPSNDSFCTLILSSIIRPKEVSCIAEEDVRNLHYMFFPGYSFVREPM